MFWIWLGGVLVVVLLAAKLYDRRRHGHMEARETHRDNGGYDAVRPEQRHQLPLSVSEGARAKLDDLDAEHLAPVVARALGDDSAWPTSWAQEPLGPPLRDPYDARPSIATPASGTRHPTSSLRWSRSRRP